MGNKLKINIELRPNRKPIYNTKSMSTRAASSSFSAMLIDQQDISGGVVASQNSKGELKLMDRLISFSVAGINVRTKNNQVPIFLEHNLGDINNALGFVDNFSVEGKGDDLSLNATFNLLNENKLAKGDKTAEALMKMRAFLDEGFNIPISATLRYKNEDTEVKLNEKLNEAYVLVKNSSLIEVSFVSSPACERAMVKSNSGVDVVKPYFPAEDFKQKPYFVDEANAETDEDEEEETGVKMTSHETTEEDNLEDDEEEGKDKSNADEPEAKSDKSKKPKSKDEVKMSDKSMLEVLSETNAALLTKYIRVKNENKILKLNRRKQNGK